MPTVVTNLVWKVLILVISRPIASAVRDAVQKVWADIRPNDPPRTASDPDAKFLDAVLYAGLTGVGFAVGELVAQKGAGEIWRTFGGGETPDQRKMRQEAEKQAAKDAKLDPRKRAAAVRKRDAAAWTTSAKAREKAFAR